MGAFANFLDAYFVHMLIHLCSVTACGCLLHTSSDMHNILVDCKAGCLRPIFIFVCLFVCFFLILVLNFQKRFEAVALIVFSQNL